MQKHPSAFVFAGKPMTLVGPRLRAGDKAPDFTAHRFIPGQGIVPVKLGDALGGKATLFSVLPSLDTPVCSIQTQNFNKELAGMAGKAHCYTVSMDLPFSQNRFCGDEKHKVENLTNLSDYMDRSFGPAYGVLIDEVKLLSRAVFVVDKNGTITYVEYVPEAKQEPNYAKALEALKAAG
jgi:thioredoxin-dependent peroxiredoxin